MANRKRQIPIIIMVNEREKALVEEKMRQLGTKNMGAYIRKMAIDGYVVRLDLSDISELVSLLRRSSNNLNQYAKRAHETGRIYEADIEDIQSSLKSVWEKADQIMTRLSTMVLEIVAFVCFAIALGTMVLLQDFPEGLRLMGLAWLISPFGLPLIAAFLVELLGVFNDSLKAI